MNLYISKGVPWGEGGSEAVIIKNFDRRKYCEPKTITDLGKQSISGEKKHDATEKVLFRQHCFCK
jgi:hypothetical protein